MPPVVADARPPGLNVNFRPGNTLTVNLTWPTDALDGRTFTASLGGSALGLTIVSDVMTIAASATQTAVVDQPADFLLTETTGGGSDDVIVGSWSPADTPSAVASTSVTVTESSSAVTVTAQAIPTAVGTLTIGGDATISGEILTGTFGSPATFGGIEREGRVFPAGEMVSSTAVMNFGDGFPRLNLPPDVDTNVYMIFEVEEWWLDSTIGVYFEWVNDHTTTGDVRWDCEIKECDIGTETLAAAGVIASRTMTETSQAANTASTSVVASVSNGNACSFNPGALASFYVLRISRLGSNAADTLAGPVGLIAASMTRGQ